MPDSHKRGMGKGMLSFLCWLVPSLVVSGCRCGGALEALLA
jgi:hypothetical protein